MKTVRSLSNWPGIGNQLNTVFHHCCLAWTLVEDDTEPIQQRQQLGTLLWLKVVQLHTSNLSSRRPCTEASTPTTATGNTGGVSLGINLRSEISMNSPTRLSAVKATN